MMVLAGAGILAIVAGLGLRTWELGRLLDEIEQSEAVMIDAQEEVRSIAEGALGEESADRAEAEESLQRIATESGEELAQIAEEIAVLRIAPWNDSIEQARTSYLAHSQAWQDFLGAASEDAEQWFETYPDIDRTWNVFVTDVGLAVPSIDAVGLGDRVDAVVGDTPGGGGGAEGTLDV
jgi:hypothetical protein